MIFKCLFWQCTVVGCFSFAWRLEQDSLLGDRFKCEGLGQKLPDRNHYSLKQDSSGKSQEANLDVCMVFDWDNCKPWDSDLSKQQSKPQMIWLVFCCGHFICMFNTEWKTILQSPKRLWGNLLSLVPMVMSVKPYPSSRAEKSIPRPSQPLP